MNRDRRELHQHGNVRVSWVRIKVDIATPSYQECFRLKIWPAAFTYN